jgi:CRP-like cAMP-binding protein
VRSPVPEVENQLLAALPRRERARLLRLLEPVEVAADQPVHRRGERVAHAYFPTGALFSVLSAPEQGRVVEVGTLGRQCFVGASVVLGDDPPAFDTIAQVAGGARRIGADELRAELGRGGALRRVLLRSAHAQAVQAAQNAACNRLHGVEQRAARWLLHCADWTGRETFGLTQQYLAYMLGVRRAGVVAAAAALRRAGLIRYARGDVEILDRADLAGAARPCYRVINAEYDRLRA